MGRKPIYNGERSGRLTVIRKAGPVRLPSGYWETRYRCECACGRQVTVRAMCLRRGHTRSCGCLHRESVKRNGQARRKHGGSRSHPLYVTWRSMRERCMNPNATGYANYGGRGIRICSRWDDFALFAVDVGEKPSPEHTLDRIDNDGGYEPGNVRWATPAEQQRNRRRGGV